MALRAIALRISSQKSRCALEQHKDLEGLLVMEVPMQPIMLLKKNIKEVYLSVTVSIGHLPPGLPSLQHGVCVPMAP